MTEHLLYRGPSQIDGAPIMAILTLDSANPKTGPMAQTWIMRSDMHPLDAAASGADVSVCGMCPHRPELARTCYVQLGQAPSQVWKQFMAGKYAKPLARTALMRGLRIGAYGDPAAVPIHVWQALVVKAPMWTGYTHQWRDLGQEWQRLCMASVDTADEADEAQALGWRTFRVRLPDEPLRPIEFICPTGAEAGAAAALHTCQSCRACGGSSPDRPRQASPVIIFHGSAAGRLGKRKE